VPALSKAEWEAGNDSARKGSWKTALMLPMLRQLESARGLHGSKHEVYGDHRTKIPGTMRMVVIRWSEQGQPGTNLDA
jgi:hypothetical protein